MFSRSSWRRLLGSISGAIGGGYVMYSGAMVVATTPNDEKVWPFDAPVGHKRVKSPSFECEVDYRTRLPVFVTETITAESVNGDGDRKSSRFHADTTVPQPFTATLDDYRGSGYSRGHMASAGAHKNTQAHIDSTFSLANIVPQELSMNGADWYRLELLTRHLTREFTHVHVINGPLFLPQQYDDGDDDGDDGRYVKYRVIGENKIAVPTHLFKIVVCDHGDNDDDDDGGGRYGVAGFVMQNEPILEAKPLTTYQAPISFIEQQAGLHLPVIGGATGDVSASTYDLCARGHCSEQLDAESMHRVNQWRVLGVLKASPSLELLDRTWSEYKKDLKDSDDPPPSWLQQMYQREYLKRHYHLTSTTTTAAAVSAGAGQVAGQQSQPTVDVSHGENRVDIQVKW